MLISLSLSLSLSLFQFSLRSFLSLSLSLSLSLQFVVFSLPPPPFLSLSLSLSLFFCEFRITFVSLHGAISLILRITAKLFAIPFEHFRKVNRGWKSFFFFSFFFWERERDNNDKQWKKGRKKLDYIAENQIRVYLPTTWWLPLHKTTVSYWMLISIYFLLLVVGWVRKTTIW